MHGAVIILLLLFFVLLFVVLFIMHQRRLKDVKNDGKVRVFQCNTDFNNLTNSDMPTSPFTEMIDEHGYVVVKDFNDANLVLFSDFALIDQKINSLPFNKGRQYYVYGLKGSDDMASKARLAKKMMESNSERYIPKSFVVFDEGDIRKLKEYHKEGNIYMLKKNIQRQEGNLITKDIEYITTKAAEDDYVVCQELLQNPYLVNKRKINLRVYMLITKHDNNMNFYIYKNGFMYYTPKFFEKNNTERDVNITTGYIDRKVYEENPLTLQDFNDFLGEEKAKRLWQNIIDTFKAIKSTYRDVLLKENEEIPGSQFNIFGVDVAPDENLNTMIIEINKGPDLSYKDERDKQVKLTMMYDAFTIMKLSSKGNPNNFMKM